MSLASVRRIALAALALPLLLGGCADDEPDAEDAGRRARRRASATETSTEPVEPTLPPEAEGEGAKAAEAFLPHFYATVDYAQASGDTEALRAMALDECDACRGRSRTSLSRSTAKVARSAAANTQSNRQR